MYGAYQSMIVYDEEFSWVLLAGSSPKTGVVDV